MSATISGISAPAGTYGTGAIIPITLAVSAPVVVTGQPALSTSAGMAAYAAGASTPTSLVFLLVVPAGTPAAALNVAGLATGTGTISDASGNPLPPTGAAGILSSVLINGVAPVALASAASSTATMTGVPVDITVAMSEGVAATGTGLALTLSTGAVVPLTIAVGSLLHFTYTPASGQLSSAVAIASVSSASPVVDRYGNPAVWTAVIGPIGGGLAVVAAPAPAVVPCITAQMFFGGTPPRQPPRIPAEFVGVPVATLQTWLLDAQTALQQVSLGKNVQSVSYSQGGAQSVSYTPADAGMLQQRVMQLSAALGLTPRRRAMRPGF